MEGTVWTIKWAFGPQQTNKMHLKCCIFFNMIHQDSIYQSLVLYTLTTGQDIYNFIFLTVQLHFYLNICTKFLRAHYVCLYTKNKMFESIVHVATTLNKDVVLL